MAMATQIHFVGRLVVNAVLWAGCLLAEPFWVVAQNPPPTATELEVRTIIGNAFAQTHDGWSADEVVLNETLNEAFIAACARQLPTMQAAEFNWRLLNMRKAGGLDVKTTRSNRQSVRASMAIAEVVARSITDQHRVSIDKVLTSPELRREFNSAARVIDPDVDTYCVRKAALGLRKRRQLRPELIARIADWGRTIIRLPLDEIRADVQIVPELPGIYIFADASGYLYIGQSVNLRKRLKEHLDRSSNFSLAEYLADQKHTNISIELHCFAIDSRAKETMIRRAYESELIASRKPKFNIQP